MKHQFPYYPTNLKCSFYILVLLLCSISGQAQEFYQRPVSWGTSIESLRHIDGSVEYQEQTTVNGLMVSTTYTYQDIVFDVQYFYNDGKLFKIGLISIFPADADNRQMLYYTEIQKSLQLQFNGDSSHKEVWRNPYFRNQPDKKFIAIQRCQLSVSSMFENKTDWANMSLSCYPDSKTMLVLEYTPLEIARMRILR